MKTTPHQGLEDDLRPYMAKLLADGRPFCLVTTYAADGGPRGVGAQMVVTQEDSWGFVSGGCIEADVALQAQSVLHDGTPKHLVYGRGSPWIDLPLPCGGRLDLLAERIEADDPAIAQFVSAHFERRLARYQSDGVKRACQEETLPRMVVDQTYAPPQRLIVVGSDPIAIAMVRLARQIGWPATLVSSSSAGHEAEFDIVDPTGVDDVFHRLRPDPWTAIAVATHDMQADERAIVTALKTDAGYIGVLGARRRIADRTAGLLRQGLSQSDVERLRMPIGLPIRAATPWEIAVSTVAQIIAERRLPR